MSTPNQPFQPIANGIQMAVRFTVGGVPGAMVMGGWVGSSYTLTQALAQAWLDSWTSNVRVAQSDQLQYTGATVRDLRVLGAPQFEVAAAGTTVGGKASPLCLAGAAALIKWNTAMGTRSGKGRTYLPGVTEADTDTNGRTLTATALADFQLKLSQYRTSINSVGGGLVPAVLSRKDGTAYASPSQSVASLVAFQRRRMR